MPGDGFNSTLVRLKDNTPAGFSAFARGFQFHIGSIKRDIHATEERSKEMFQFHIGSIKSSGYFVSPAPLSPVSIPHWFD